MKLALALAALLLLAGCGSASDESAADPSGTGPASSPPAAGLGFGAVPPAHGEVTTRTLATVMDTGRPELCLGPVAESYPPQCRGIPLRGWDWGERRDQYDSSGDVRWGQFAVTGTFDGTALTVTGVVPAAAYDPAVPDDRPSPDAGMLDPRSQAEARRKLSANPLPGTLAVYPAPAGIVVEVVHDDGSLQAAVDAAYGPGVVVVQSMLVPVNE